MISDHLSPTSGYGPEADGSLTLEDRKFVMLSPGQDNLIAITFYYGSLSPVRFPRTGKLNLDTNHESDTFSIFFLTFGSGMIFFL